jgi:hypothetical protein
MVYVVTKVRFVECRRYFRRVVVMAWLLVYDGSEVDWGVQGGKRVFMQVLLHSGA